MYITVKGNNGNSYDDYYRGKNVYFKLYDKMLENRDSNLDVFLSVIKNSLGEDFDGLDKINLFLEKTKTVYSVAKTDIMFRIINNIQNKDKKGKEELDTLIKKNSLKSDIMQPSKSIKYHQECMEKIVSDINTVITDERSYKELVSDGVITDDLLYSKANKYVSEIDDDMYLDFALKYKEIEPLDAKELVQYKEVLEFFIRNLQKKLIMLNNTNDDKTIRNLHVSGENNLSINIISHTDKLKRWKMKKLSVLLEYYTRVYETISKIINTNSVDSIEKIKFDKEHMKYEEDFICEYHKELQDICSLLTHIKKMNNVTNERNKKLCKKFNEKVLRNNK